MAATIHVPRENKHTRLFQLAEPLTPRGSAKAIVMEFDGCEWQPGGETFTVCDTLGMSGDAVCRGRAMHLFGQWHVIELQCE